MKRTAQGGPFGNFASISILLIRENSTTCAEKIVCAWNEGVAGDWMDEGLDRKAADNC
jgi:hypothetical protein